MPSDTTETITEIEAFLETTRDDRLEDYLAFLRIPSISALSEHAGDMVRAAGFVADAMRAIGIEHVEVSPTPGHPIVYGDWLHADDATALRAAGAEGGLRRNDAPTVLVYCHYDVQPVDPLELWVRPPFEPRVESGRVYARGAADDKGQLHLQLWAARAWLETQGRLPVNIRYVFEGEEESGSGNFDAWILANRHRLGADVAVISDTGFFEGNLPAICVGLRGLMYAQVDVTMAPLDLHSGGFGGNVQNPAIALARIVAGLKTEDGAVDVAGFYDEVRPISEREHAEFERLPLDDREYAARIGVTELFGEPGYLAVEREGARPTLDVNGIWGGFQGEGSKTIIPAHAHAKLSCRLVADMDPQRTFERVRDRILALAPRGVTVDVTLINTGMWSLTGIDHPATVAAARALEEVFGQAPLYVRGGGSIPAAATFATELGLPVVLLGFANPGCQAHAPNESMRLDNYEGGLRTVARYWAALAD